jgi:hypothetical protein
MTARATTTAGSRRSSASLWKSSCQMLERYKQPRRSGPKRIDIRLTASPSSLTPIGTLIDDRAAAALRTAVPPNVRTTTWIVSGRKVTCTHHLVARRTRTVRRLSKPGQTAAAWRFFLKPVQLREEFIEIAPGADGGNPPNPQDVLDILVNSSTKNMQMDPQTPSGNSGNYWQLPGRQDKFRSKPGRCICGDAELQYFYNWYVG